MENKSLSCKPFSQSEEGFALPQILLLSIILGVGLTSLLAASIYRLSSSKINTLEINSRNASYSAITNLRALLNNATGINHYYWLAKVCGAGNTNVSDVNKECPTGFMSFKDRYKWPGERKQGSFPDMSKLFWEDTQTWCNRASNCWGRQVAPVCTHAGTTSAVTVPWTSYTNGLKTVIDNNAKNVKKGRAINNRDQLQSFFIKSINFVGNEYGGENSILAEGFSRSNTSKKPLTANNKVRVNVGISRVVSDAGFAFISAGENENDKNNSLFLGNFSVDGDKRGTILWRKNIYNPSECISLRSRVGSLNNSGLPDNKARKGGIWAQPLLIPGVPAHKNLSKNPGNPLQLGSIFCTPHNSGSFSSKCNILNDLNRQGTRNGQIKIDNLNVQGERAIFAVSTTDNNPVTLEIHGNIDVSNGGKICHYDGNPGNGCGSGKPQNLTINFKGNDTGKDLLQCSSTGGPDLKSVYQKANNTFVLSQQGDKFTGLIHAPNTTMTSATADLPYYQTPYRNVWRQGGRQLVVANGAYAVVENPESTRNSDKTPRLIKWAGQSLPFTSGSSTSRLGPFRYSGWVPLAVGRRQPGQANRLNLMSDMVLFYNKRTRQYILQGIYISSSSSGVGWEIARSNRFGQRFYYWLPTNLSSRNSEFSWLRYHYGIDLVRPVRKDIEIDGVAWVKNLCLDRKKVRWTFSKKTSDGIKSRYGGGMNFGVPFYRGKVISAWDTLREFDK